MNATKYQIFLKTVECGSFTKAAGCEKSLLTHSSIMPKEPLTIKVYVVFNVKSSKPGYFCRQKINHRQSKKQKAVNYRSPQVR